MKQTLILLFLFLCSWCFGQKSVAKDSVQRSSSFREYVEIRKKWKETSLLPANGCVTDEKTAIKIAEAIWYSIYGDEIYEEKPYKAKLEDGIWIVKGTFHGDGVGGTAYIEIQKSDCKILMLTHGK